MVFNKLVDLLLLLHQLLVVYWVECHRFHGDLSMFVFLLLFSFPIMGLGVNMIDRWICSRSDRDKKYLERWFKEIDEITDNTEFYNTNGNSNLWIGCKEIELELNFILQTTKRLRSHQHMIWTEASNKHSKLY